MYKTVWCIYDEYYKTELTWYHFGKEPRFPSWYLEEGTVYEIEMIWNIRLIVTVKTFLKCLFHKYVIHELES